MDGTTPTSFDPNSFGATDVSAQPPMFTQADNPSNGLDLNSLLNGLIGTAGSAYATNQNSQAAQAIANSQAQYAALNGGAQNPLAIFSTSSGKQWLIVGAGILALALILRH